MNIEPVTYVFPPPDRPVEGPTLLHEVLHQWPPGQPSANIGAVAGTMGTRATVDTVEAATGSLGIAAHTRLLVLVRRRPVSEVVWKNI